MPDARAMRDGDKGRLKNVLFLPDALSRPVESVGADDAHGEEVVGRAEAASGEIALFRLGGFVPSG